MKTELNQLNQYILHLQTRDIYDECSEELEKQNYSYENLDKLVFTEFKGLYHIIWYGADYGTISDTESEDYQIGNLNQHCECDEEKPEHCYCVYEGQGLDWLIDIITQNPEKIGSLEFTGPNCGSNGIRNWNLERLVKPGVKFPNLTSFKIQLHEVGNHNMVSLSDDDTENPKHVTDVLSLFPNVETIEVPGVPSSEFFKFSFPKLYFLRVQSLWEHGEFIKNLTKSPLLSQISLDFTDTLYRDETPKDGIDLNSFYDLGLSEHYGHPTPFEDYKALFHSEYLKKGMHIKLREYQLSQQELFELQKLKDVQFLHIPTYLDYYISHKMK